MMVPAARISGQIRRKPMAIPSRLLGIIFLAHQASGQVLYPPVRVSTIGNNDPLEFADLNGDGLIDLAGDGAVALGDGQGAFLPAQSLSFLYLRFCAADFDRDGRMDLTAVGSTGTQFLRGDGAGGFTPGATFMPITSWSRAADLDGDGDPDLAAFLLSTEKLRVALSNGDGTFSAQPDQNLGFEVLDGVLARVDGDGNIDLAVLPTSSGAALHVALGQGNGQFGSPVAIAGTQGARCLALADLDLDGDLDLAFGQASSGVAVLANDGTGQFSPMVSLAMPSVQSIRAADMNGDGLPDLVANSPPNAGGGVRVALGLAGGGFGTPAAYEFRTPQQGFAISDVDGDGVLDVLVHGFGSAGTFRLRGIGAGRLESYQRWWTQAGLTLGLTTADFDGDGHADVLAYRNAALLLMRGDGTGFLETPIATPFGSDTHDVRAADFDNDGDADLAVADRSLKRLAVLFNDGTGAFANSQTYTLASYPVLLRIADQDGDGHLDLAALGNSGTIHVLRGDGGGGFAPVGSVVLPSYYNQRSFVFTDVDGDGRADLVGVTVELYPDELRVFLTTGPGMFALHQSLPIGTPATEHNSLLEAGDVDGDGDLDLAVGSGVNYGTLRLFLNDGSGTFSFASASAPASGEITSIAMGNVDWDPRQDVVAYLQSFAFLVFPGTASGLGPVQSYSGGLGPVRTCLADLDEDGWLDVAAAGNPNIVDGVTTSPSVLPYLEPPTTYCTAKTNSLGCVPAIASSGTPSASATSGFVVRATDVISNKYGLLAYGFFGRDTKPFAGGTLCVKSPIKRTPGVYAGGTPTAPFDCSGVFAIDLNAFAHGAFGGNPSPLLLQPGHVVVCQWWGRDPGFPSGQNVQLSDALEFALHP